MKRYSLADYILSIKSNDPAGASIFGPEISIGGEGTYTGSIDISLDNSQWTTTPYSTGAWIHNKNLSKVGKVNVTLNQLSDQVSKFKSICETFYSSDYDGFTLTVMDNNANLICECEDCYIQGIPTQNFRSSAEDQSWTFTCGKITFK